MAELAAIRARLKDRQVKEGALGTAEASICLDLSLLADLAELEREHTTYLATRPKPDPDSLAAGAPAPDVTPVDEAIEAKKQEIREASLRVVFAALSSKRYQEVVNVFEDPDGDDRTTSCPPCAPPRSVRRGARTPRSTCPGLRSWRKPPRVSSMRSVPRCSSSTSAGRTSLSR